MQSVFDVAAEFAGRSKQFTITHMTWKLLMILNVLIVGEIDTPLADHTQALDHTYNIYWYYDRLLAGLRTPRSGAKDSAILPRICLHRDQRTTSSGQNSHQFTKGSTHH